MRKVVVGISATLLAVAYPVVVSVGLKHWAVSRLALLIAAAAVFGAALRWLSGAKGLGSLLVPPALVAVLASMASWQGEARWLLALPSLVNIGLLISFGQSLWLSPPLVERFARLVERELSTAQVAYCRQVTRVWCGFFIVNAGISGLLAWRGPMNWWVAYTGLISYVLVGSLMAGEYVFRKWRFQKFGAGLHDRFLAFFLAPRAPRP